MELLVLLRKKGEHADELVGLVRAMRHMEPRRRIPRLRYLVDGCGTGGDRSGTFNISTIACLVSAGAGARVAKHGNRSISSNCGSGDLLEALGVEIQCPFGRMMRALKDCGIGYFHAPLYHPIIKSVHPIRSVLARKKLRTIFNLVGPLTNPLRPRRQAIGVFAKPMARVLAEAVKKLKLEHALIFSSDDHLDELSTTGKSLVLELVGGILKTKSLDAGEFGLKRAGRATLRGGGPKANRRIALRILRGKDQSARRDTVLLNAGAILYASGRAKTIGEGIRLARRSIDEGAALRALSMLTRMSHDSR